MRDKSHSNPDRQLQRTRHLLSEAVDIVSLIEVSHSIRPDPRKLLFVPIAVHTRIVDRVPLVQ